MYHCCSYNFIVKQIKMKLSAWKCDVSWLEDLIWSCFWRPSFTGMQHWILRMARAFGTVGHACAMKCKKCEKEGKAYALHWKGLKMWVRFRTAQNAKIQSILKTTTHFICFTRCCCSLSYSSFSTQTSRRWGCIYALSSHLFSHQTPSSFFLAPITTFAILTSWQWDR